MSRPRTTIFITLALLLGAATSIAIPWAIALHRIEDNYTADYYADTLTTTFVGTPPAGTRQPSIDFGKTPTHYAWVFYPAKRGHGWTELESSRGVATGWSADTIAVLTEAHGTIAHDQYRRIPSIPDSRHLPQPGLTANNRIEIHFGWPMRALWGASDLNWSMDITRQAGSIHTLSFRDDPLEMPFIQLGPAANPRGLAVPTGILPLGFAADTLLYAALWLPLVLLPGALRRTLRRRRNQCPTCAYDLRATPRNSPCPECGRMPVR